MLASPSANIGFSPAPAVPLFCSPINKLSLLVPNLVFFVLVKKQLYENQRCD